jgi:ssDNA-binding Zn-finger/Zn-ribbon topoisomerase 1
MSEPLCPVCKAVMVERNGVNGPFWSCSKFPACKGTRNLDGSSIPRRQDRPPTAKERAAYAEMLKAAMDFITAAGGVSNAFRALKAAQQLMQTAEARTKKKGDSPEATGEEEA